MSSFGSISLPNSVSVISTSESWVVSSIVSVVITDGDAGGVLDGSKQTLLSKQKILQKN